MKFSDIPRNPDNRMLRQFAGLWILFFGVMALAQHFRSQNTTVAVHRRNTGAGAWCFGAVFSAHTQADFCRLDVPGVSDWMADFACHPFFDLLECVSSRSALYCDERGMIRFISASLQSRATGNKRLNNPVCVGI